MSLSAKIDEGRFETGLYAGYFALIKIGLFLDSRAAFDVAIVESLTVYEGNTAFLFLCCINTHSFHGFTFLTEPGSEPRTDSFLLTC